MVNPRLSQSPLHVGGSQPQMLGSTTCPTQVGDNPSGTAESSVEPTIRFDRLTGLHTFQSNVPDLVHVNISDKSPKVSVQWIALNY